MRVNNYSSLTLANLHTGSILNERAELVKANYEAVNGRYYDMSATLGHKVKNLIEAQMRSSTLENYKSSNGLLEKRYESVQFSLKALTDPKGPPKGTLQNFLENILGTNSGTDAKIAVDLAKTSIDSFMNFLNGNFEGYSIFGGEATKGDVLKPYKPDGKCPASADMQAAFDSFMKQKGIKSSENMTADQMQEFLDGPFAKFFEGENWQKYFSNVKETDAPATQRINDRGKTLPKGVTINEPGFREAFKAMIMIAEFGTRKLNVSALRALETRSTEVMAGGGITGVLRSSSQVGIYQNRLAEENGNIAARLKVLNDINIHLGSVDPAEASTRVNALENALNISYQLTSRLSKLSLANYI